MAINISYLPSAGTTGGVAYNAGKGIFQQRDAARQDQRQNMLLNAGLQMQQQRFNQGLQMQDLQARLQAQQQSQMMDLAKMQFQAGLQREQAMFDNQLRGNQMQQEFALRESMGQQQLEQQQALAQQKMQQEQLQYQLQHSTQARAAYDKLQAERQAIDQALSDQFVTAEQHQQMLQAHAVKAAGFDPNAFLADTPFPEGQRMGDVWQEEFEVPGMGTIPIRRTRDRNGVPVLTDESEIMLNAMMKQWGEQQAVQMDAAAGAMKVRQEFDKRYDKLIEAYSAMGIAPTPQQIQQDMALREEIFNSLYGGAGGDMPMAGFGGMEAMGGMSPGGAAMGGGLAAMMGAAQPQMGQPQQQPMGQPGESQTAAFFQTQLPPQEFASYFVTANRPLALNFLMQKYQNQPGVEVTDPYDLAIFAALKQLR